jgi:membrane dipeptidase
MEDVSALPLVTARLLAAGYGEDDVRKIWGGNLLRVLREAQSVAEPSAKP